MTVPNCQDFGLLTATGPRRRQFAGLLRTCCTRSAAMHHRGTVPTGFRSTRIGGICQGRTREEIFRHTEPTSRGADSGDRPTRQGSCGAGRSPPWAIARTAPTSPNRCLPKSGSPGRGPAIRPAQGDIQHKATLQRGFSSVQGTRRLRSLPDLNQSEAGELLPGLR